MSAYFKTQKPAGHTAPRSARRRLALATLLDRMVAPFVDADRSLIISGFWRSGTTWLQHALAGMIGAKVIFEPLHWYVREMGPVYADGRIPSALPAPNAFMPYLKSGAPAAAPLLGLLQRACRGSLASPWVRNLQNRPGLRVTLRQRVVVKSVRLTLALPGVHSALPNPILHVYRDPRAVVASGVYKTGGMWRNFDEFSLAQHLLELQDGRAVYFRAWKTEICRLDKKPMGLRLAAYWALTERYLQDAIWMAGRPNMVIVAYETLAADPAAALPHTLDRLGLTAAGPVDPSLWRDDSPSTTLAGQSRAEKIHGWRELLSAGEQAEIAALAADFGLRDRLAG